MADRSGSRLPSRLRANQPLWMRRALSSGQVWLIVLLVVVLAMAIVLLAFPRQVPITVLALPLLVGGRFLDLQRQVLLTAVSVVFALLDAISLAQVLRFGEVIVLLAVAAATTASARVRIQLGVQGSRGETTLLELRNRLAVQARLPEMLIGWTAQSALSSAGGSSFSGDFLVSATSRDSTVLEVALVDVSGKGLDVAARSLQLSGAMGGLLGSVDPDRFLPAANEYVLRRNWQDDFATVAHVTVDLITGAYQVRTAGHPAPVHLGPQRWRLCESTGPFLGLIDSPDFVAADGVLAPGESLLLYSDGMVESSDQDLDAGTHRLVERAEDLLTSSGCAEDVAQVLVAELGDAGDDATVVVIHRDADAGIGMPSFSWGSDLQAPVRPPGRRSDERRRRRRDAG